MRTLEKGDMCAVGVVGNRYVLHSVECCTYASTEAQYMFCVHLQ